MASKILRHICIIGKTAFVLLTQSKIATIDAADVHLVEGRNWCARKGRNTFYACSRKRGGGVVHLHRLIMNAPPDRDVDHEDLDGLNCRRSNMRLATGVQNTWNSPAHSDNASGLKGVSFHRPTAKWRSRVYAAGRNVHLGLFDSAEDAHSAYSAAVARLRGEFARAA